MLIRRGQSAHGERGRHDKGSSVKRDIDGLFKIEDIAGAVVELGGAEEDEVAGGGAGDDARQDAGDGGGHGGVHLVAVDVVHGHAPRGGLEVRELGLLAARAVRDVAGRAVRDAQQLLEDVHQLAGRRAVGVVDDVQGGYGARARGFAVREGEGGHGGWGEWRLWFWGGCGEGEENK